MGTSEDKRLDTVQTGFNVIDALTDGSAKANDASVKEAIVAIKEQNYKQRKIVPSKINSNSKTKPYKIKLAAGDKRSQGMYLLLEPKEVKYTSKGITAPPNRTYQIQVAVEVMYNNKRCRGKRTFNIPKGTSITKAVESIIPKKSNMIEALKTKGTLKIEKITKVESKPDGDLDYCFEKYINKLKAQGRKPNTLRVYGLNYRNYISIAIGSKKPSEVTEDDVQAIITDAKNAAKANNTIAGIKRILKPLLEQNDRVLNWKKIGMPKVETGNRKYNKPVEVTAKIVEALINYQHKKANGVFRFLLTGRRVNEVLYLEHEQINYEKGTYTILSKYAKTNRNFTFKLTPALITAIKAQDTKSGRIFRIESRQMLEHFKNAMRSIGIYDMVLHDIRSMVAQTALDAGADIYEVSKMLSHQKVSTTEASYAEGGANQAIKAQQKFEQTLLIQDDIIDLDVLEQTKANTTRLKEMYPKASNEVIAYAIDVLEGRKLK
ncbi:tyrosine-type recombinase/integrase [Poseidonibacter ostreae]|uniref:Tyrosine-type recombinase/integrase n=1 Tax=Poseidonibacter ostreae TaxID=2654171 RepID=A0ABQ6VNU7_9BACT|nr:tyrosine-type recombinase/integrase [Poseidonibacter ostreae]KAB7892314.1 tyrosine-type recombinase/integrase [Poseidonibacter ostreae]